ncbi:MAG: aspartate aminotransferase family protein, partial [Desulfobacterales bacterium]|nr:aspartate aminotransferase family protein [Desulfobacterales bacterium]
MESCEPSREDLLKDYGNLFSRAGLARLKALGHDIIPVKKEGAFIIDFEGRRFVDCITAGGIFNLGRRPRAIVDEFKKAMVSVDQGNFPLISREKARLAEALAAFTPGALECSVFSVSRGEAFEFACKLSRGFTKRPELIAVDGSWFGQTGFALSLSERKDKKDFGPPLPGTRIIEFGNDKAALEAVTAETAAVFLEPIQAENHCREAHGERLAALKKICRDAGALLVFDETQTNMGRTGKKFAFEHCGVEPDILILGEAVAGGVFPITATIYTQRLNAFMNDHPLIHLSTFGGSDLGCAVTCKALEVYEETRPWENARETGET